MKLIYSSGYNSGDAMHDSAQIIDDDGKTLMSRSAYPLCECPEDATLERDINSTYDVIEAFILGYKAAQENKTYKFIEEEELNQC